MTKKLLAVGCSYTADVYPFPVWPQLLAKKFNMECINLGQAGRGNEYIYSRTLDTLVTEKNIGLVVVMWSEFQRLDFCFRGRWKTLHFKVGPIERNTDPWANKLMNTLTEKKYDDIVYQTERSIRLFYSLQQIMKLTEYNNIPFYQLAGPVPAVARLTFGDPYGSHYFRQKNIVAKTIIENPYLNKIDERLFLGWPMFDELGGWNIDTWLDKVAIDLLDDHKTHDSPSGMLLRQDSDLRISKNNSHPNKKGHKKISEMLYNEIKRSVPNGHIQTT